MYEQYLKKRELGLSKFLYTLFECISMYTASDSPRSASETVTVTRNIMQSDAFIVIYGLAKSP